MFLAVGTHSINTECTQIFISFWFLLFFLLFRNKWAQDKEWARINCPGTSWMWNYISANEIYVALEVLDYRFLRIFSKWWNKFKWRKELTIFVEEVSATFWFLQQVYWARQLYRQSWCDIFYWRYLKMFPLGIKIKRRSFS